ncbi:hypothetical protein EVAR_84377_1 [Eumeta japonica]|uniref:Reverse transcriptase domain-containing protein n=1 Tax=Eumeta variegata TaxID=151549 RepID=A0A4C1U4S7_EUMVA|nr:hypothetical protein EVAR_84377_1 [Eumeta japonica]
MDDSRMDELPVRSPLYAVDQVILVPSACGLQKMVIKTKDSVRKRGMKVNVGKTKVMVFESMTECNILIESEKVEQVKDESWVWQKKNESRINAVEMRSLRSTCGVSRKDRCGNSDVRERCGLKEA